KPAQDGGHVRLVENPGVAELHDGDPGILRIEIGQAGGVQRQHREDVLRLDPADGQERYAEEPAPDDFKRSERGTRKDPAHLTHQRLGSTQRSGHGYFTTKLTS